MIVLGGFAWRAGAVEFWILPCIPLLRADHLRSILLRNFGVAKRGGARERQVFPAAKPSAAISWDAENDR